MKKILVVLTNAEEQLSGKKKYVPFLNEEVARNHGAHFLNEEGIL